MRDKHDGQKWNKTFNLKAMLLLITPDLMNVSWCSPDLPLQHIFMGATMLLYQYHWRQYIWLPIQLQPYNNCIMWWHIRSMHTDLYIMQFSVHWPMNLMTTRLLCPYLTWTRESNYIVVQTISQLMHLPSIGCLILLQSVYHQQLWGDLCVSIQKQQTFQCSILF